MASRAELKFKNALRPAMIMTSAYNIHKMAEWCFAATRGAQIKLQVYPPSLPSLTDAELVSLFRSLELSHAASDKIKAAAFSWEGAPARPLEHYFNGLPLNSGCFPWSKSKLLYRGPVTGIMGFSTPTGNCNLMQSFCDFSRNRGGLNPPE